MVLEDIKKLADMARIEMTDQEMQEMVGGFDSILAYVGQIQNASEINLQRQGLCKSSLVFANLYNVARKDVSTNESESFTDRILEEMPETQDGFLKVKKIL